MNLKALYIEDKTLFTTNIDKLENLLISDGTNKEEIDPLIKILKDGFISKYSLYFDKTIHVGVYNTICFKVRDQLDIPIDIVKKSINEILDALSCKIEGSPLDLMNPPMDD